MVKIFALSTARIDRSLRSVPIIRCPLCVSSESVDLAGIAEGGFAPEQEKEEEERRVERGSGCDYLSFAFHRSLPHIESAFW